MSTPDSAALAAEDDPERGEFARAVREGLTRPGQKELPSRYLYDEVGSALFDVITLLPEYGLTRADERLLQRHADSLLEYLPTPVIVTELGSGVGRKTRWILQALAGREPVTYYPIDVSAAALAICEKNLGVLEDVSIVGLEASYLRGLGSVAARRRTDQTLLVLFLGSSIGNFDRNVANDFLCKVRRCLLPGDTLLLSTDLRKPVETVQRAYDDPAGVTAAFNRNILVRINRELDANFDLRHFAHEVRYDAGENRLEMHLRSTRAQRVRVAEAGFECRLEAGETIWTEASHKYALEELPRMADRTGFHSEVQWVDFEWPFAQSLWRAV